MAKTSSNVMISDFKEWLKGNGNLTPNSANSYISYLGVSYNNDLSLVSTDNVYSRWKSHTNLTHPVKVF